MRERQAISSAGGVPRGGRAIAQSGLVSVIPQPCSSSTPCSAQRSISTGGTEEPPQISIRSEERSRPSASAERSTSSSTRRDAGAEADPLGVDQPRQVRALEELLDQQHLGADLPAGEGQAPGVGVEHRHGEDGVVAFTEAVGVARADGERLQPGRAVAVGDALRRPGGAGRVAEDRGRALVDVGELEGLRAAGEYLGVGEGVGEGDLGGRRVRELVVEHDDEAELLGQLLRHRLQQRREAGVDEEHRVARVADDVGDLLGGEAEVQGVEDGAEPGDGVVGLEVAGVVPAEGRDAVVGPHAEGRQPRGEPPGVGGDVADPPPVHRLAVVGPDPRLGVEALGPAEDRRRRQRAVLHRASHRRTSSRFPPGAPRRTGIPPILGRLHPAAADFRPGLLSVRPIAAVESSWRAPEPG